MVMSNHTGLPLPLLRTIPSLSPSYSTTPTQQNDTYPYPHYPRLVHTFHKTKSQSSLTTPFLIVSQSISHISIVPPLIFHFSIDHLQCTQAYCITNTITNNPRHHHRHSFIQLCMMRTHRITSLLDHFILAITTLLLNTSEDMYFSVIFFVFVYFN